MAEMQQWRKRGRHFDRVFTLDVDNNQTAITIHALGELARLVPDQDESHLPVLIHADEVQRMLALAGYTREELDGR